MDLIPILSNSSHLFVVFVVRECINNASMLLIIRLNLQVGLLENPAPSSPKGFSVYRVILVDGGPCVKCVLVPKTKHTKP